jgi:ABC-type transport system substrate-binding protein
VLYTCEHAPCTQAAAIIKHDLAKIGIDVEIKTFGYGVRFAKMATEREPFDIGEVGWSADYQDPANFLNQLLDGRQIKPHGGTDFAYFDDPSYNRKLHAAARLSAPERYRVYGALAEDLARNAAPMVAYAVPTSGDFFSTRVGCQVYQPIYGYDLGALCIRSSVAGGGG